ANCLASRNVDALPAPSQGTIPRTSRRDGSTVGGSTWALVTTDSPSATTNPVPRNANGGTRVGSIVPIATIEPFTRSIVLPVSLPCAGNAGNPSASDNAIQPHHRAGERGFIVLAPPGGNAPGQSARMGDGPTIRAL